MAKFPTTKWFEEVRSVFNADESYRGAGGGYCNCTFGVKTDAHVVIVTMEGAECSGAVVADEAALDEVDFYLHMNDAEWREMLEDIAEHGQPSLSFTLNALDLDREDGLAISKHGDQYREDLFFRYNQTLQYLFNASARVKTTF